MKKIRKRLTFSNVIACLALFVALGGASYAATQLPKNSVGTKQLKKNAVTTPKVKKNTITTAKIRNQAVTGAKIKNGTITASKLSPGAVSTDGTVSNADHANTADSAKTAASPTTLASGATETGVYATVGNGGSSGGYLGAAITFAFPLPSAPKTHYLKTGEGPTAECPGSATEPKAEPGQLCAYEIEAYNTEESRFFDNAFAPEGVTRFGAQVAAETPATTINSGFGGVWAVTAP